MCTGVFVPRTRRRACLVRLEQIGTGVDGRSGALKLGLGAGVCCRDATGDCVPCAVGGAVGGPVEGRLRPTIAMSPWIPERTVVNDEYRATSLIRTLRERWDLGPPLTGRDAVAPDLAPVLSLTEPRSPETWPDVTPQPVPDFNVAAVPLDQPLGPLSKGLFFGLLALGKELGQDVPDILPTDDIMGGPAIEIIVEQFAHMFPLLQKT